MTDLPDLGPMVTVPTFVAFVSPHHGFGVYAALAVAEKDYSTPTRCIGTYGGMACKCNEQLNTTETYQFDGALRERVDENQEYVRRTLSICFHLYDIIRQNCGH